MKPEDFYNQLADDYDDMTRFAARLERERGIVKDLLARFQMQSCIDAACGTGLHAIALAETGVKVTGADISPGMLERARSNAAEAGVEVNWVRASFAQLSSQVTEPVDALLCLGNSIPHVLDSEDLNASLASFKEVLKPGGICIIQLLNYERILAAEKRIVGAHRTGDVEFIRFYDFLEDGLRFNILRLRWDGDRAETDLQTTVLHPYTREELNMAFTVAGFDSVETFSDLAGASFVTDASTNLVIIATTPR